jgi:catalase (peroxidase I)
MFNLKNVYKMIQETQTEGNHVTELLSVSDLIQIAGASAIEYCGGPFIELKVGRKDIEEEHRVPEHTSFPHLDMGKNNF